MAPNEAIRINKYLALLGFGSRRKIDQIIANGRVFVNNKPAIVGQLIRSTDSLKLDGMAVNNKSNKPVIVLAFNKPVGVTSTKSDPHARSTIMDYLPSKFSHLVPVGRLDKNSRGLILLTNDGELALHLTHPRYEHEKEYELVLTSIASKSAMEFDADINKLSHQIIAPEAQTKPIKVLKARFLSGKKVAYVTVVIQEGKKRQLRRLFSRLGYEVLDLKRVRVANITLDDLKEGEFRIINSNELNEQFS